MFVNGYWLTLSCNVHDESLELEVRKNLPKLVSSQLHMFLVILQLVFMSYIGIKLLECTAILVVDKDHLSNFLKNYLN